MQMSFRNDFEPCLLNSLEACLSYTWASQSPGGLRVHYKELPEKSVRCHQMGYDIEQESHIVDSGTYILTR
jgi:hypothetical protein